MWAEKYAPQAEEELVVHKKKVAEVRAWLEQQAASLGVPSVPRLLVVSGPSGCGKSTVLHVLAGALGFELCEWTPPAPTTYVEYQYARGAGLGYASKLDAFEEFVLRSKLPALAFARSIFSAQQQQQISQQPSQQQRQQQQAAAPPGSQQRGSLQAQRLSGAARPKLTVVDDLPHAAGPAERARLAAALGGLARTSRFPLVICVTETSGKAAQERGLNAAAGSVHGLHKVRGPGRGGWVAAAVANLSCRSLALPPSLARGLALPAHAHSSTTHPHSASAAGPDC